MGLPFKTEVTGDELFDRKRNVMVYFNRIVPVIDDE
jgi:hypothetical protein